MKAILYKTQKGGACFARSEKTFRPYGDPLPPFATGGRHPEDVEADLIKIYPQVEYQTWQGFGAAITEASAVAWLQLSQTERDRLIRLYFSDDEGIGYNFCRLAIGSCDFSVDAYSYVEEGDETLATFDVSREDTTVFYMVREAQKLQPTLRLFASPWTPPRYMKTNDDWQGGYLKEEYYPLWAAYFAKYVTECKKRDIIINGVTVQNEPRHHQMWESCTYTPEQELEFVNGYLAKALKPLGVKIYV